MLRIRHCVECPACRTRYLISLSPYKNGSYLIATVTGSGDEYILYCRCRIGASRWREAEVMACEVSRAAYERGFGTQDEILRIGPESRNDWSFDASNYLSDWRLLEKRKNPD